MTNDLKQIEQKEFDSLKTDWERMQFFTDKLQIAETAKNPDLKEISIIKYKAYEFIEDCINKQSNECNHEVTEYIDGVGHVCRGCLKILGI